MPDTTDLQKRLRRFVPFSTPDDPGRLMHEAADALEAQDERLEEYTSGGHVSAHKCEYDSGHILHGAPSLCVPCRVDLEKRAEKADAELTLLREVAKRAEDIDEGAFCVPAPFPASVLGVTERDVEALRASLQAYKEFQKGSE